MSSSASRALILSFATALVLLAACSDDEASKSSGSGDACASLCTGAGFSGGAATDFGKGLVECMCTGAGAGVQKSACESYCSTYKVPAAKALLSKTQVDNDKCVCDGTSP